MIDRRAFLRLSMVPIAIGAQDACGQGAGRLPRVVWVSFVSSADTEPRIDAFLAGMREAGQADGRTFRLEMLYANGDPERSIKQIREAASSQPAVMIVAGLTNARRAYEATRTVPIVIGTSSDLADAGLIESLRRPGGNVTGIADNSDETAAKRFELLRELLPRATRVGLLNNPEFPATPKIERMVQAAARSAGVTVRILHARDRTALDALLGGLRPKEIDALLLGGDGLFVAHSRALIERATALQIPVVHFWPTTAEQGALLVHAPDVLENFRRSASYVDRILKGAHPGDLPIYQPTRYELVVNLRAARTLGVAVPQAFLLRVDRVIE